MSALIAEATSTANDGEYVEYYPKARFISFCVLVLMTVPYVMTATSVTIRMMWRAPELTVAGQTVLSMMLPAFGWATGFIYYSPLIAALCLVHFFRGKSASIAGPVVTALFVIATAVGFYLNSVPASPIIPAY